jgi:hypothetical protein
MYYIYHIKGVKIGCTTNQKKRIIKRQGFTEYEILETHTDIYIASKREIELQKQYGYSVDRIPYYRTIKVVSKGGKVGGPINLINGTGIFGMSDEKKKQTAINGGKVTGNKNAENGRVSELGKISAKSPKHPNNVKRKCVHCGKELNLGTYGRWHGDKCKNKNTPI